MWLREHILKLSTMLISTSRERIKELQNSFSKYRTPVLNFDDLIKWGINSQVQSPSLGVGWRKNFQTC